MVHSDKDPDTSATESEDYSESEPGDYLHGLSEEQKKLVKERLALAQQQFRTYNSNQENQKIADVLKRIDDIDQKAADLAIRSCAGNELLAIKRLMDNPSYKTKIIEMSSGKREVDMEEIKYYDRKQELREALEAVSGDETDGDEADEYVLDAPIVYRKRRDHSHTDNENSSDYTSKRNGEGDRKGHRLTLDEALILLANYKTPSKESDSARESDSRKESESSTEAHADAHTETHTEESAASVESDVHVDKKSMIKKEREIFKTLEGVKPSEVPESVLRQLGWSEARIRAFRNRDVNPNMYYYRFNDPGVPQATGKWSKKDNALFLKTIEEYGVDYRWGIFSTHIPGRVGYQCSNYYRQLVKEGKIKDENYVLNKDGKLVFRFRDAEGNSTLDRRRGPTISGKHRKRVRTTERVYDYIPDPPQPEENVLPDYIDPMTMMPVEKPAISPYGHVMGYDSWVKVLNRNPKNTCPFTKKKLTRRSLVKLNSDNIDEYRDKIINVNGFDIEFHDKE